MEYDLLDAIIKEPSLVDVIDEVRNETSNPLFTSYAASCWGQVGGTLTATEGKTGRGLPLGSIRGCGNRQSRYPSDWVRTFASWTPDQPVCL